MMDASPATTEAPLNPQAVQFYNQALALMETDKQLSYKLFVSALGLDQRLFQAWFGLGMANSEAGLNDGGIACLRRAVELEPSNARAWTNLGHLLYSVGNLDESKLCTLRALSLDPRLAMAHLNLSLILSVERDNQGSLREARKAYELDPMPGTELGLAFALLNVRDLKNGLKHFEAKLPHKLTNHLSFPYPRWDGEDLREQTLFVMADQGMGDTLDYLRFVPAVAERCGHVVMQVQNEMIRLTGIMLSHLSNVQIGPMNAPFPPADFWIPITSTPVALDLSSEEIERAPQLQIPMWEQGPNFADWKAKGRKLHVGIAWAGATGNDIDHYRSMELKEMLSLARVPGIQLYSFQVGHRSQDVNTLGVAALVSDMTLYLRDVADTVGFIRELDCIVSIESFLPHLANAVGVEVLVPYCYLGCDYRIGRKGTRTFWHEKTKVFYQEKGETWAPVMAKIVKELTRRVEIKDVVRRALK